MEVFNKDESSKRACKRLRQVFAESIPHHPDKKLDFNNDDTVVEVFTDEWTWYMQGAKDEAEQAEKIIKSLKDEMESWKTENFENVEMGAQAITEKDAKIKKLTDLIKSAIGHLEIEHHFDALQDLRKSFE